MPIKDIEENDYDLSVSKYREIEYDVIEYEKPQDIVDRAIKLEKEIGKELEELKKML